MSQDQAPIDDIIKAAKDGLANNDPKLSLFYKAVSKGLLETCKTLVEVHKVNFNADLSTNEEYKHESMLLAAMETEHWDVALYLVNLGTLPKVANRPSSYKLMQTAANFGNLEFLELLVKAGFSLNPQVEAGDASPLQTACRNADLNTVKWLAEHGADLNFLDFNERDESSPLKDAVRWERLAIVEYLLQQGCDVNSGGLRLFTALDEACGFNSDYPGGSINMVKLLVRHGALLGSLANACDPNDAIENGQVSRYMSNVSVFHTLLVLCYAHDFNVSMWRKLPKELLQKVPLLLVQK
jgi:ankyrin repeat protein